jgi:hypothetical protein
LGESNIDNDLAALASQPVRMQYDDTVSLQSIHQNEIAYITAGTIQPLESSPNGT